MRLKMNKYTGWSQAIASLDNKIEILGSDLPTLVTFYHESQEIGKLWVENGELRFSGSADEAAREFFKHLINQWANTYYDAGRKDES
jgi:hypothetical protein